jgi:thioredoxin-like negative regulator of GroEL
LEAKTPVQKGLVMKTKAEWGIFISSDYCSGCVTMKPVIQKLIDEGYRIRLVDFHKDKAVVKQYGITKIPALILKTNQGQEVKRWIGQVEAKEIKRFITHA